MSPSNIVIILLVALSGFLGYMLYDESNAHADTKLAFSEYREKQKEATIAQEKEFRKKEQGWQEEIDNLNSDWRKAYDGMEDLYKRATDDNRRLRGDLTTLANAHRAAQTATALTTGPTAYDALDLLTELLGSQYETETTLARALDASYAAGVLCVKSYEITR